jgi:hypothetical protein
LAILLAAAATITFLVVLATNIAPWIRGPKAWRWPYAIPGTMRRLWLPALLLVVYIALAWWLDASHENHNSTRERRRAATAIVAAMAMTPAIQFALLYMDHPDVRSQLFYRTVAEGANGFFNVGAVVMDRDDFLRYFSERMIDWYPTHPERHPPGLPVLFSLARQFFDATPGLTARLNDLFRSYQCHNVSLMNLPDGAIASATLQMVVPLLLAAVVPLLYLLGRELYGRTTAVRAILLWPLMPGIALWAGYWTPLYTLFTVSVLLSVHAGLSRRRLLYFLWSGVTFSVSLFLAFGNAPIIGFVGLYALFWLAAARPRPQWHWLLRGALLFALGTVSLWLWLWFRHGLGFFAVWRTAIGRHLEMDRTGWFWMLYHLYDFFVAAAGIPILFFWALHTLQAVRAVWTQHRTRYRKRATSIQPRSVQGHGPDAEDERTAPHTVWLDALALSFVLGLLVLDLANVSRGEVARVWACLLPLPLLVAAHRLPQHRFAFLGLTVLLSAQLFVTNIYVRYIGTDLSDPPSPPPAAQMDAESWTPWQASWEPGISLQAIRVPTRVVSDGPIAVDATWTTSRHIRQPYTIFVHLYDPQDKLAAQRDIMPLDGGWPTTCWQPRESFEDHYELVTLYPLTAGLYRLELGIYWLPSGERLPVQGQGAQPSRTVNLGTIQVGSNR